MYFQIYRRNAFDNYKILFYLNNFYLFQLPFAGAVLANKKQFTNTIWLCLY